MPVGVVEKTCQGFIEVIFILDQPSKDVSWITMVYSLWVKTVHQFRSAYIQY